MKFLKIISLLIMIQTLTACGIQSIPKAKLDMEGAFAEITNQYVDRGSQDVEKFLTILKERLHQEMLLRDDDEDIDFIEDDMGMKVVETE